MHQDQHHAVGPVLGALLDRVHPPPPFDLFRRRWMVLIEFFYAIVIRYLLFDSFCFFILFLSGVDDQFPNARRHHEVTSDIDSRYNCIAWATGDNTEWWSHKRGYKWPANRTPMVTALMAVFRSVRFKKCDNGELEAGYEKIVLYSKYGIWKHAARQLPSGKWASKLGEDEDIEHDNPENLCGDFYGEIHCYMRRLSDKKAKIRKASGPGRK